MGELLVRYEESGIDERILRAVEEMGFVHMTPIQEKAIPVFLEGRDVIGQAQTGTGARPPRLESRCFRRLTKRTDRCRV